MVKKMNKTGFIKEIKKQTNLSENESILLNDILEENGIFGRKNKNNIVIKIQEKLNVSEEKATEIYEIVSSIAFKAIKDKIRHPFKS